MSANKVKRIKSLVEFLKILELIDKDVYLNPNVIAYNANVLNSMIYEIYKNKDKKTPKDMAKYINKRYEGKLDEEDIKRVWSNKRFINYMDMMYSKQDKLMNELNMIRKGKHDACKYKVGGDNETMIEPLDNIKYSDNLINKFWIILNDPNFMKRNDVQKIVNEIPLLKAINEKNYDEITKVISEWIVEKEPQKLIDYMLFPLYYIENTEGVGPAGSIIIDMIGMLINGVDLLAKVFVPIIMTALGEGMLALEIGTVGVATPVVAAFELLEEPIQFFLMGLPSFIKLLLTIQRKQFKQALNDLVNIFPIIGVTLVSAVNTLMIINKFLIMVGEGLKVFEDNLENYVSMLPADWNNITSLDMGEIYKKIVNPNMKDIGLLNKVVNMSGISKIMDEYQAQKDKIMSSVNKVNNVKEKVMSNNTVNKLQNIADTFNAKQNEIKNLI
jgi:hypothetical protein